MFAEVDPHDRTRDALAAPGVDPLRRDREQFAVAVRDRFGRLAKNTILAYIEKCIHSPNQIDRKTYGAGLGLYLVANAAATLRRQRRVRDRDRGRVHVRSRREDAAARSSACSSIPGGAEMLEAGTDTGDAQRPPRRAGSSAMAERQFGPYRLVRQIAVGGMAEIHLAKTKGIAGFEKYVALKMIHPNFAEDEQFIQMLVDEAKIAVQLTHANIAQTFDLGRVGETYYITMEYVDGADLYKILRRGSEQDLEMPLDVCAFIAQGDRERRSITRTASGTTPASRSASCIATCRRRTCSSRYAGEVKLVDFGIAKATMKARQTAVGVIKGKYYYMSPGAGVGRSDRLPLRHLLGGHRALRDDHRADALSRGGSAQAPRHGAQGGHRAADRRCARASRRSSSAS